MLHSAPKMQKSQITAHSSGLAVNTQNTSISWDTAISRAITEIARFGCDHLFRVDHAEEYVHLVRSQFEELLMVNILSDFPCRIPQLTFPCS